MIRRAGFAFWLDGCLLAAVCSLLVVRLTGLAVHEWLAFVFAAAALVHLLLSWNWIEAATRRVFSLSRPRLEDSGSRHTLNYCLNFALFADLVILLLSGIMISRHAGPALGLHIVENLVWRRIHVQVSNLAVILTGLHVALNWDWIGATVRSRERA